MLGVALLLVAVCVVVGLVVGAYIGAPVWVARARPARRGTVARPKRLTRAGRQWARAMADYMRRAA